MSRLKNASRALVLLAVALAEGCCEPTPTLPLNGSRADREVHFVSPHQLIRAGSQSGRTLQPLFGDASSRREDSCVGALPLIVIFIKKDCPCSGEFEPFFHRLEFSYRGKVRFLGVMDGTPEDARAFAAAHRSPYEVLADPNLAIIREFSAEHGSYVALIRPDGTLATLWPGLSADMMTELSSQIAQLAQIPTQPIEVSDMPKALMTGCPYPKE